MRTVENTQMHFGEIAIAQIEIDSKSRDDIPAVLKGLQHIYTNAPLRERVFALLLEQVRPGVDLKVGRPGMDLWRIFVLAVLKQGLGCDFDRLQELANQHQTVRQMLGHGDGFRKDQTSDYQLQTLIDNVSLLSPQLLSQIGQVIVQSGHEVARKKPGAPLRGRCDSFVVETDVHYPTDIGLLYDSMRCVIRETRRAAQKCGLGGWRQHKHLERGVRKRFNRVRDSRRWHNTRKVKDYVQYCRLIADRAQATVAQLEQCDGPPILAVLMMEHYLGHAWRQMDQVERRLLNGESIARTKRRCFRCSRSTPDGSPRARPAWRWSRRLTILSIGVWNESAVMVPMALSAQLHCRCWLPICIALGCCCSAESAKGSGGRKRYVCAPPEVPVSKPATAGSLPLRRERLPMPVR